MKRCKLDLILLCAARDTVMIEKHETRTDRLNRLCLCARRYTPVSLEDRACLESCEHLINQAIQVDS
jgi:hypothetical protein